MRLEDIMNENDRELEMRKYHITFPEVIYNRNIINYNSFILRCERIIKDIVNKPYVCNINKIKEEIKCQKN